MGGGAGRACAAPRARRRGQENRGRQSPPPTGPGPATQDAKAAQDTAERPFGRQARRASKNNAKSHHFLMKLLKILKHSGANCGKMTSFPGACCDAEAPGETGTRRLETCQNTPLRTLKFSGRKAASPMKRPSICWSTTTAAWPGRWWIWRRTAGSRPAQPSGDAGKNAKGVFTFLYRLRLRVRKDEAVVVNLSSLFVLLTLITAPHIWSSSA